MEELKNKIINKFSTVVELLDEESLESLKKEVDQLYVVTKMFIEIGDEDD